MPLGVLGHCGGVKGLCTQAALGLRAAKVWGDKDCIPPAAPWAPFPQATHNPIPFQASSSHPQHDHPNPAQLRAMTARMYLLRRKGPAWGCRVGILGWVGSRELCPSLHPLAIASPGMWICMAGSLLSPFLLQQTLCVPDLLATPPWADGGVFSEGEGPRGESLPMCALL